jgi:S1-C subfamily serine protease
MTILAPAAFPATFGRTWKSSDMAYSVDAEFVDFKDGTVSLRKPNGAVIRVPVSSLSAEDQAYVAEQAAAVDAPPTGKQTYTQLVQAANCLHTAAEALRMYKLFLQHEDIAEPDRKAAEEQLPVWEERAKKRMVRVGLRWLEPAEANDLKRQARQLTDEALRLLEVGQDAAAIDKCVKASKLDPDAILADFLLGLGYALVACDAKDAKKHFTECIRRDPRHVSALNNLALSEVRLGEYTQALAHWQAALEVAPATPEIVQNLGRLLHLANQGLVRLPTGVPRRFSDLYAATAVSADAKEFNREVGWLYMGHYAPLGELSVARTDAKNKLRRASWGTGFVVHPEYVLTNRHVVKGCAGLLVVPPGQENHELPASVVGVADGEDDDLAVIHCKGLTAPPLPFIRADLAPRGTEIMVLGFPDMISGKTPSLTCTRGIIASLPDTPYNEYTLDAVANPGNSGGPICDATGGVLGILCAGTVYLKMNYSLGVPHSRALPLLKKLIPGYEQLPPNANKKEWSDVDGMVSRSTVLIWVQSLESVGGISRHQKAPEGAQPFEDRWCMTCYGRGTAECPVRECANGRVRDYKLDRTRFPDGSSAVMKVPIRVPCKTCGGEGVVRCPNCDRGIDWSLAGKKPTRDER